MTNQLTLGFTATTQISRTDFGLGLYAPAIGDEVSIRISGEAIRKADIDA
ncbi:MAG: YceI family protein [Alphaproteobacteria bacterium]